MSEHQYYEFQAVDRPLGAADQQALRAISSRALITATSFTNTYEWGSLKGDPLDFMRRWFDLHLYLANWPTRRLTIRVPRRLLDPMTVEPFIREVDWAQLLASGEHLILDLWREDCDIDDEAWEDGSGRLAGLAPLRADIMAGDLRLFYLIWLTAIEDDALPDDEPEPLPGIGPLTGALGALADFFGIDPDLVAAAAARRQTAAEEGDDAAMIAALPEDTKTALLLRAHRGDPHVAVDLRRLLRAAAPSRPEAAGLAPRTVAELKAQAASHRLARERAEAAADAAERARREEEARQARAARLVAIRRRGEGVWREVEAEIELRSAKGYARAAELLADLRALAEEQGTGAAYALRLAEVRNRHARKGGLIARLTEL